MRDSANIYNIGLGGNTDKTVNPEAILNLLAHHRLLLKNVVMNLEQKLNYFYFFWGLAAMLAVDLVAKFWVVRGALQDVAYIEGILYFIPFQKNDGIAFGIDLPLWVQVVGSVIIIFLLLALGAEYIFSQPKLLKWRAALLGTVIGGGLGNLIDRILHGYVVDFIVLKPFPVFNFADIGITVGLILLFVTILLDQKKDTN